jgi:trehalose-6-phosphate synthase
MGEKLIMASNRLPVSITTQGSGLALDRSIGGVATALDAIFKRYDATWIGWTGLRRVLNQDDLHRLHFPKRMVPVQAEADLVEHYYDRMTNRVLWPSFHNIKPRYRPLPKDWDALHEIGRRFAMVIKENAGPRDLIWVHDYHLILVPALLRELGVTNRIGYFWHTPFPSPEYFFRLPHYEEILTSISQLDLLGLQAQRDVDNFWACMQIAKRRRKPGLVAAFPIGIDFSAYHAAVRRPSVRVIAEQIKKKYTKKRMILSISRLDYTKGIPNQLRAVEQFFESKKFAERKQFTYKLVVAPSREDVIEYSELRREIDGLVTTINKKLSAGRWKPIEYAYENFGFADMTAWYRAAEVFLLLPRNDGMNLIAKEFVATAHSGDSVLILSNTTGAAAQLQGALQVDPGDIAAAAAALDQAFNMTSAERKARWASMLENVREQNVFWWADEFITALEGRRT